jgi:hypothetical protein
MRKLILILAACSSFAGSAFAEPLRIEITNKTAEVIKSITAVPRAGGATIQVSEGGIAVGGVNAVEFEAPASTCVFTLTTLLASGKTIVKENVFLCHTKELVIE